MQLHLFKMLCIKLHLRVWVVFGFFFFWGGGGGVGGIFVILCTLSYFAKKIVLVLLFPWIAEN